GQHAAAQGDQDEVYEELAGEPEEVHPPLAPAPPPPTYATPTPSQSTIGRCSAVRANVSGTRTPGAHEGNGKRFTTSAASANAPASHSRLDVASGRSHAKYATTNGSVRNPMLSG